MRSIDGVIHFSAADLVGHLSCRHLTKLDAAVARGELEAPKVFDPLLELLRERGATHEQSYIDHLEKAGFDVAPVNGGGAEAMPVDETIKAMGDGRQIIVQGGLADGRWSRRTDILRRVDFRETKGGTILQLSLYSERRRWH